MRCPIPALPSAIPRAGPVINIGKDFFVRIGSREPDTVMFRTESFEERDMLIEADPQTFFITDHFRSYKGLLAHLAHLDAKTMRALLERRRAAIAPKSLSKTHLPRLRGGAERALTSAAEGGSTSARPLRPLRGHSPRKRGEKLGHLN